VVVVVVIVVVVVDHHHHHCSIQPFVEIPLSLYMFRTGIKTSAGKNTLHTDRPVKHARTRTQDHREELHKQQQNSSNIGYSTKIFWHNDTPET
jgi:hypothetical protein